MSVVRVKRTEWVSGDDDRPDWEKVWHTVAVEYGSW